MFEHANEIFIKAYSLASFWCLISQDWIFATIRYVVDLICTMCKVITFFHCVLKINVPATLLIKFNQYKMIYLKILPLINWINIWEYCLLYHHIDDNISNFTASDCSINLMILDHEMLTTYIRKWKQKSLISI